MTHPRSHHHAETEDELLTAGSEQHGDGRSTLFVLA